jgi:chemotaxis family two-component system response regulator Rcp1
MGIEPILTLRCVRKNGRRESTELTRVTLSEARALASQILALGKGFYTEVDICAGEGVVETIDTRAVPRGPAEVLLVEDNAGDALLIRQAVAEYRTPIRLHIARDGEQALQILRDPEFLPDLVILDLNIPKISGFAVLAAYPMKKTPVVVFSASENGADVSRALSLGANEFVHKPLDLDDYKNVVTGMVQKWVGNDSTDMESLRA